MVADVPFTKDEEEGFKLLCRKIDIPIRQVLREAALDWIAEHRDDEPKYLKDYRGTHPDSPIIEKLRR